MYRPRAIPIRDRGGEYCDERAGDRDAVAGAVSGAEAEEGGGGSDIFNSFGADVS